MTRVLTIAANTFTEVIRQPVYLVILGCAIGLILLSPYFTMFALMNNIILIKDMGLATLLLAGLLIAAFSASSVIHREIDNRTVLTVISKPISRPTFVLGKFLGIALGILAAEYILSLLLAQTVRTEISEAAYSDTDYPVLVGYIIAINLCLIWGAYTNFFNERPFTSSVTLCALVVFTLVFFVVSLLDQSGHLQAFAQNLDWNILVAALLIFLATTVLAGIAVAASTRLSPGATLGICFFFFLLGLLSDYFFGRYAQENFLAEFLYRLVPNLQIFLVVDAIIEERHVPKTYIFYILGYTVLYLTGILAIAMALFQEREAS